MSTQNDVNYRKNRESELLGEPASVLRLPYITNMS